MVTKEPLFRRFGDSADGLLHSVSDKGVRPLGRLLGATGKYQYVEGEKPTQLARDLPLGI
jgi:hypothetical protein